MLSFSNSASSNLTFGWDNASHFGSYTGNGAAWTLTTSSFANTTTWYLFGYTKATGTTVPRYHWYDYTAGTWSHEAGSGSAVADNATTITNFDLGRWADGSDFFNGTIAAAGAFRAVVPTDAELDGSGLPFTLLAWYALAQRADRAAWWVLDQGATTDSLLDRSGGGANQSATTAPALSTLSVPLLGYGAPILAPTVATAAPPSDRSTPRYFFMPAVQRAATW